MILSLLENYFREKFQI